MSKKIFFTFLMFIVLAPVLAASAVSSDASSQKNETYSGGRQFTLENVLLGGTPVSVTVVASSAEEGAANAAASGAISKIKMLDSKLFSEGGVQSKLNSLSRGQALELDADSFELIKTAVRLAGQTNGWFDIAAPSPGSMFVQRDYRRIDLNDSKHTLTFKSNDMRVDLSKIALGYMVDMAMKDIENAGFKNAMVKVGTVSRMVGRDIFTPWQVQIDFGTAKEYAHRANNYNLTNVATASVSATNLGNNLIDARSKKPVEQNLLKSVTVMAGDASTATAYALAAYTLGPKTGIRYIEAHPEVKGIIVDNDGNLVPSIGFKISQNQTSSEVPTDYVDRGPANLKQREAEEGKE